MRAYLLVLEIEPMEEGRIYDHLMLHCTVVHWFWSEAPAEQVLEAVSGILAGTVPVELVSGARDWFGPSRGPRNIAVNRIVPTAAFRHLHDQLVQALAVLGPIHTEPGYLGAGFNPHVSRQENRRFEGKRHMANSVYLVEALEPEHLKRKQVLSKVLLGTTLSGTGATQ